MSSYSKAQEACQLKTTLQQNSCRWDPGLHGDMHILEQPNLFLATQGNGFLALQIFIRKRFHM